MVSQTVQLEIKYTKLRKNKIAKLQKITDKFYKEFNDIKRTSQFKPLLVRMSAHRKKKIKFIRDSQKFIMTQNFKELAKLLLI